MSFLFAKFPAEAFADVFKKRTTGLRSIAIKLRGDELESITLSASFRKHQRTLKSITLCYWAACFIVQIVLFGVMFDEIAECRRWRPRYYYHNYCHDNGSGAAYQALDFIHAIMTLYMIFQVRHWGIDSSFYWICHVVTTVWWFIIFGVGLGGLEHGLDDMLIPFVHSTVMVSTPFPLFIYSLVERGYARRGAYGRLDISNEPVRPNRWNFLGDPDLENAQEQQEQQRLIGSNAGSPQNSLYRDESPHTVINSGQEGEEAPPYTDAVAGQEEVKSDEERTITN